MLNEEQKNTAVTDIIMRELQLLMNVEDSLKKLRYMWVDEDKAQRIENYLLANHSDMRFLKTNTWVNILKWNMCVLINEKDDICIHIDIL